MLQWGSGCEAAETIGDGMTWLAGQLLQLGSGCDAAETHCYPRQTSGERRCFNWAAAVMPLRLTGAGLVSAARSHTSIGPRL